MNLVFKPTVEEEDCYDDEKVINYDNNTPIINVENIHFTEPVQNAIMNDSYFIRIIYSDDDASLTGLMIPMYLNGVTIFKSFNKSVIMYDLHSHKEMILKICDLEVAILERYCQILKIYKKHEKCPVYNLTTQLRSCSIKLFDDIDKNLDECNIVLKISGIWENEKEIGITFKFILLC
jgi:hypothetical protein